MLEPNTPASTQNVARNHVCPSPLSCIQVTPHVLYVLAICNHYLAPQRSKGVTYYVVRAAVTAMVMTPQPVRIWRRNFEPPGRVWNTSVSDNMSNSHQSCWVMGQGIRVWIIKKSINKAWCWDQDATAAVLKRQNGWNIYVLECCQWWRSSTQCCALHCPDQLTALHRPLQWCEMKRVSLF